MKKQKLGLIIIFLRFTKVYCNDAGGRKMNPLSIQKL